MSQQTKVVTVKLLGLIVPATVPATAEYRDSIVGPNSTIDEQNDNDLYRGYASKWRTEFFKQAKELGLAVNEGEKDKPAVDRWQASGLISASDLQKLADKVTDSLDFITWLSSSGQRAAIGKGFVESAQQIVNSWGKEHPDQPGVICSAQRTESMLRKLLPTLTFSEDPTVEEVAYALRDYQKAQEAAARKQLL